jgi:tRNA pseudouridine55 synthase
MSVNTQVSGLVFIDKPLLLSSAQVGFSLKKLWPGHKIGHGGTLDPLATGMLPIMVGNATKLSSTFLGGHKVYVAALKLGLNTTTLDQEGEITRTRQVEDSHYQQLPQILELFVGKSQQVPPIYSALKHMGKPLYWYARKGDTPPVEARSIEIFSIKLIKVDILDSMCWIEVNCGSGTYIRTLAQDIGEALGCGAALWHLRRTSVKGVAPQHMIPLAQVQAHHLLSAEPFFTDLNTYELSYTELYDLVHTGKFYLEGYHRIYYQHRFVGILRGGHRGFTLRYLEHVPIN